MSISDAVCLFGARHDSTRLSIKFKYAVYLIYAVTSILMAVFQLNLG